jgi:hypothetical protein
MMDAVLMLFVLGAVVLALGMDLAALVGWLRRRWRGVWRGPSDA